MNSLIIHTKYDKIYSRFTKNYYSTVQCRADIIILLHACMLMHLVHIFIHSFK